MAAIVERWSPFPKPFGKRHDLFGIFDIIVLKPGGKIFGVQATTNAHVNNRVEKLNASENLKKWKDLGGEALVVGWAKMGARGKRKTWQIKEVAL